MEFRLIHAHNVQDTHTKRREWRIINPLRFGIRIDESQITNQCKKFFSSDISCEISHFLTEIAGEGGLWDGWTLYAVGKLRRDLNVPDATPYFRVVFVRRAENERASEKFEILELEEEAQFAAATSGW